MVYGDFAFCLVEVIPNSAWLCVGGDLVSEIFRQADRSSGTGRGSYSRLLRRAWRAACPGAFAATWVLRREARASRAGSRRAAPGWRGRVRRRTGLPPSPEGLDTDLISEAMKPEPRPAVRTWLNEQVAETLYLTSVTLAEILFGIALLPAGTLTRALDGLLGLFGDRVLPFDTDAARHYIALAVAARTAGRGFPTPDGYIAAIAASRGFIVASRDTSPYEAGGLRVVDPWQS
jgi:toxin FitB